MALARQVGLCIRTIRKRRGLTQAALAELIDRSEVGLRALERGASAPSFETLERLSVALEVPTWALFQSGGEPSPASLKRARDMATICDLARGLNEEDLEMVVDILGAISKRRGADG